MKGKIPRGERINRASGVTVLSTKGADIKNKKNHYENIAFKFSTIYSM